MANHDSPGEPGLGEIDFEPIAENLPAIVDWLPQALIPVWQTVAHVPLLAALIVVFLFFFAALFVRFAIFRSLQRLAGFTSSILDDHVLQVLQKPVFTTVLYVGLTLATKAAKFPFGTKWLINLLVSVIVASWMRALIRISTAVLHGLESQRRFSMVEPRTVPLLDLSIKLGTILVGGYLLLLIWGINPVGWLASAGIVGIAVGFAAKDTLANLFSGFFIIADAPYQIGDFINLDSGERGQVSAIGLRSTRLLTRDDVEITIPNGVIANAKIINESGGPYLKMRNRIRVGVAYGSDLDQVSNILLRIADEHPRACTHPEPRVRMRAFGASSLDIDLLVWIEHPQDRGLIAHELLMQIYKAFGDANIEIPYSKHDVFIKELPADRPEGWSKQSASAQTGPV